jgi:hypothetical protein
MCSRECCTHRFFRYFKGGPGLRKEAEGSYTSTFMIRIAILKKFDLLLLYIDK